MDISEVRVKLVSRSQERLRAFCSITLDNDFVIRDLKIIDGANGTFVAMPSRKLADRCPTCGHKNHLRARFCNDCGKKLSENRDKRTSRRSKLHADIAHPINTGCRERIQNTVIEAFQEELEKSKQPGYQPVDLDEDFDNFEEEISEAAVERPAATPKPPRGKGYDNGGGYEELIADLKRDAAQRHAGRSSVDDDDADEQPEPSAPEPLAAEPPAAEPPASRTPVAVDSQEDDTDDFGAGII